MQSAQPLRFPSNLVARLSARGLLPVFSLAFGLICLAADYVTGPAIQFPVLYLAPISLASWYTGRTWGLTLAVILPLLRLSFFTIWDAPWGPAPAINAAVQVTVFTWFAWLVDRTSRQMRDLMRMRLLEGILGVCRVCKKIRDQHGDAWQPIEAYAATHPNEFQHDVCPDCERRVREVFDRR